MNKEYIKFTFTDCKDGKILVNVKQSKKLKERHLAAIAEYLNKIYSKLAEAKLVDEVNGKNKRK